jgi:hypothetical protein
MKRSRFRSEDNHLVPDVSPDLSNSLLPNGSSNINIDSKTCDNSEDYLSTSVSGTPHYSALTLPTIIEEDAEDDHGKSIKKIHQKVDDEEDDSPFFIDVDSNNSNFED